MKAEPLNPSDHQEWLMRISDVAEMLACSDSKVRELIDTGQIGYCDLSAPGASRRSLRIPRSEAERLMTVIFAVPRTAVMDGKPANNPFTG